MAMTNTHHLQTLKTAGAWDATHIFLIASFFFISDYDLQLDHHHYTPPTWTKPPQHIETVAAAAASASAVTVAASAAVAATAAAAITTNVAPNNEKRGLRYVSGPWCGFFLLFYCSNVYLLVNRQRRGPLGPLSFSQLIVCYWLLDPLIMFSVLSMSNICFYYWCLNWVILTCLT